MKLYDLGSEYERLLDLIEMDPEDDFAISQLRVINDAFEDKADNIATMIKSLNYEKESIGIEERKLQTRKKAVENKISRLREYLMVEMAAAGKDKIKTGRNRIRLSKSKFVDIYDAKELDQRFLVMKPPEPSKTAIKKAIEAGEEVKGAQMGERMGVVIQ